MDYFYSLVLFAIASSATPGPNNILVLTSGLNFGVKRSLPLLSGICVGFAFMLMLVGVGFGYVFELFPSLHLVIKVVGTAYLLYLSWLIATSSGGLKATENAKPMSFVKGALFQWVNAKAWVVATGAIAAFTTTDEAFATQTATLVLTFLVLSVPSVGIWLMFGSWLKKFLQTERNLKLFNYSMALLLAASVIPVVQEIAKAFA